MKRDNGERAAPTAAAPRVTPPVAVGQETVSLQWERPDGRRAVVVRWSFDTAHDASVFLERLLELKGSSR